MTDDDIDGFMVLFENNPLAISKAVPKQIKPTYEPVHLPLSIIEILQIWSSDAPVQSASRVGISPCDSDSFDAMFVHTWGEFHIEQPSRLASIIEHLHHHFWIEHHIRWRFIKGRAVTNEEIRLVHSERFLQDFLSVERGETVDQSHTVRTLSYANAKYDFQSIGPIIARACRIAAGAVLQLISSVVHGEIDFGFALIRPAGHHSSTDQIGTFCGLNSVAIGAVYAIEILRLNRVLILDWDVHRSGGTEQILGQMSIEEQDKYRLIDIYAAFGKCADGKVTPRNCELIDMFNPQRIPGDEEYIQMFDRRIIPKIVEYSPALILVSAGFDAAQGEAEECAQLTPNGYFQMTKKLKELKIPLVFILEGGYQLQTLVQSVEATLRALFNL